MGDTVEDSVEFSVEFNDIGSPDTADHDDIDFDISTPRDRPPLSILDLQADPQERQSHEVPSIVITEPSCANFDDLKESENEEKKEPDNNADDSSETENNDGILSSEAASKPCSSDSSDGSVTESGDANSESVVIESRVETDNYPVVKKAKPSTEETNGAANKQGVKIVDERKVVNTTRNRSDTGDDIFDDKKEEKVSEMITNLHKLETTKSEEEFTNEVDEMVSLDNILMKDKSEEDSDSEFDFDLPPVAGNTSTVKPVQQEHTVTPQQPVKVNQSVESRVVVPAVGVPAMSHDFKTPDTSTPQTYNSSTQKQEPVSQMPSTGSPSPQASSAGTQKPVAVIKPTSQPSQAPYDVPPPPDEGTQQVLESAQAEWDKVRTIQAGYKDTDTSVKGAEPAVVQTVEPMSSYELLQIIKQDDFSQVRATIKPTVDRHGFSAFVSFLFGPPKLHRDLIDERDRVFCIAASQLNNDNSSHIRILQTIYRSLTGSKFDCPRIGSHWEEIGFQGTDPATDLRGAGILGLVNLLHLLKDPKKHQLASDIYRLSLHPTQNFPFCVMGINLSRITLQTLREGLLNKECNRQHEVVNVVNDFYVGLYLLMYQIWKGQGKTISDSGFVIKDIETKAKKSPRDVFKNLEEYLNKKTVVIKEKSIDLGGDNFMNVCED